MGTGINGAEFMVLLLVAIVLIGPEKLPELAQQLGRLTRELKALATGAQKRVREELGPEFDDLDLTVLDPRQYDPRRIVREALLDDEPVRRPGGGSARPVADRRGRPAVSPVSASPTAAVAPPSISGAAHLTTPGPSPVAPSPNSASAPDPAPAPAAGSAYAPAGGEPPQAPAPSGSLYAPDTSETAPSPAPSGAAGPSTSPGAGIRRPIQSPRDIVARTRGVVPAAESPVVLAALGGAVASTTPNPQVTPAGPASSTSPEEFSIPSAEPGTPTSEADTYVVPFDDEAT